jgi:hypothetical protein
MMAATAGVPRYRLDFTERGHQRGAIRRVVERAYELAPEILNDSREAPWSVDIVPTGEGRKESYVELRPRLYPDPRLAYRQGDIPAASHPPLAASMARLAGPQSGEVVWDPFCGSGLELVERGLLGGVKALYGTDLDSKAIDIANANLSAAMPYETNSKLTACDFRAALDPESAALAEKWEAVTDRVAELHRVADPEGLAVAELLPDDELLGEGDTDRERVTVTVVEPQPLPLRVRAVDAVLVPVEQTLAREEGGGAALLLLMPDAVTVRVALVDSEGEGVELTLMVLLAD